jgi:hypothetical protein
MSSNNQLSPWLRVPWPHGLPPVAGCQATRLGYMVACRHSSMKAAVRCCRGDGGVTPVMHQWWHGTPRWVVLQRDKSEGDAVTVMLELLGQAHKKSLIIPNNLKGPFMYGGWQLFCPTLLLEVEGILLKRWLSLYAFASVWRRGEREKHMRARPSVAWRGEARQGDGHEHMTCM